MVPRHNRESRSPELFSTLEAGKPYYLSMKKTQQLDQVPCALRNITRPDQVERLKFHKATAHVAVCQHFERKKITPLPGDIFAPTTVESLRVDEVEEGKHLFVCELSPIVETRSIAEDGTM